jgi:hypothetical protein
MSKSHRGRALRRRYGRAEVISLFSLIRHGSRVTIVTPHGSERTGRAVMRGPAGWVLNMGGPHGTPGIASPDNVIRVKAAKGS